MSEQEKPSDLKRGMNLGVGLIIGIIAVLVGLPMVCCMSGSFISAMGELFGDHSAPTAPVEGGDTQRAE